MDIFNANCLAVVQGRLTSQLGQLLVYNMNYAFDCFLRCGIDMNAQ